MKFKVSDDKELVAEIREKIKQNGGFCPCKLIHNDDTRCICKEFMDQEKLGSCGCGLYIKLEA